ncbi:MAG TPA: DUF5996 family protein, partial [Pyrinomonadaceae bacterium]|nr:DUF5996 family protein [Pyrinomonadaceae bacterium]
ISFGFWFGDDKVPAPAFYAYVAPEPAGLAEEPLSPATATWAESNGAHLAMLMYEDVRSAPEPHTTVLGFLESAYQAGAKRADWKTDQLTYAG